MKIATYIFRFLLALIFVFAGIEKLFLPYNPSLFKADVSMTDPKFFEFYNFLQQVHYLYFVGFFQLLCGLLLIFKRTHLLGAIMLVPLLLCLVMTHVLISKFTFYVIFDGVLLGFTGFIIAQHFKELRALFLQQQSTWF